MENEKTDRQTSTPRASEKSGGEQTLKDVMTRNPSTVTPQDDLERAAKLMVECDCGALPIVDENKKLRGMITDRDIVIRSVANGRNPLEMKVSDVMTAEVFSVRENETIERVFQIMSERQVRRLPVLSESGELVGIVAQADLALDTQHDGKVGRAVEKISEPGQRQQTTR